MAHLQQRSIGRELRMSVRAQAKKQVVKTSTTSKKDRVVLDLERIYTDGSCLPARALGAVTLQKIPGMSLDEPMVIAHACLRAYSLIAWDQSSPPSSPLERYALHEARMVRPMHSCKPPQ